MSRVVERLAAAGEAGSTLDELVAATGLAPAVVRQAVAHAVFVERTVTCDVPPHLKGTTAEPGRFRLGDPASLLAVRP